MIKRYALGLALAAVATAACAQAWDPLSGGPPPASAAASGPAPAGGVPGMREYPVRTPVPANAVELSAGVRPPPGKIALADNMPGHRRFKPPLFPNAGWDSPLRANGDKFYDSYLIEYWKAPYLRHGEAIPTHRGFDQRGWIAPAPYRARIARSNATPEQDALFERRMQYIVGEVMKARPLQNLYGASISPELTIEGYGQQYGKAGDGVMRGEIVLQLNIIAPDVGATERMPNGTIRSEYFGPTITIKLNPDFINCAGPLNQTPKGAACVRSDGRVALATTRPALDAIPGGEHSDPRLNVKKGVYADGRPATDIRMMFVQHDRKNAAAHEISRGRMHPHDPLGRVIGVMDQVDWDGILQRANAVK